MTFSLPGTIILWTLALWALGWLTLPFSRRVFAGLPDGGLAAGRVLFVIIVTLAAFWGAAAHVLPLRLVPMLAIALTLGAAFTGWNAEMRAWARDNWRALLVSDAIFLLGWAAFLWIRLQHPEINDLEKPMDAALLSAAWKTDWLPFAHPWFSGASFTNYYYFGPLMGALMGRALGTPPHIAYNLVQPAFCAFFLSSLWALGAALTRSKWWGIAVMLLVGLSGPLEPLRQWSEKGWQWPFDWWTTARVIPNTINEYPAFTMAIGDAHAHFYALSFAALWLSLAWSLFAPDSGAGRNSALAPRLEEGGSPAPAKRRLIIVIGGLVLGAWLMTNTWDAPIFGLIFGLTIYFSQNKARDATNPRRDATNPHRDATNPHRDATNPHRDTTNPRRDVTNPQGDVTNPQGDVANPQGDVTNPQGDVANPSGDATNAARYSTRGALVLGVIAPFIIALAAAALYFWKFRPTIRGVMPDIWLPDLLSFGLLWGGWIVLGALAFLLPATENESDARFRRLLIGAGLLALVAPFLFYIKGVFGDGDLRHQDTIFKFGLQAWVLLGVGLSAELGARLRALSALPKFVVGCVLILVAPVLALAPATTIWTRAITQGTAQNLGQSLDGMRYLPHAEQRAIAWLQNNGRAGEIVMEGVQIKDGSPVGDYDGNWGRVGAFSGLSSTLGWPQHVWGWDGNYQEVFARGQRIAGFYGLPSAIETARGARELGARYTFFGRVEGNWRAPSEDEARAAGFTIHQFDGDDGSRALIMERIGR